jgi:hypothetical protein
MAKKENIQLAEKQIAALNAVEPESGRVLRKRRHNRRRHL